MKIISVMPAATASSTAYWISGLSTMGSISFGWALVAGRKRLPRPATGNTAFLIALILTPFQYSFRQQRQQTGFVEHGHAQALGLGQLAAGFLASHQVGSLLRYRIRHLAAGGLDQRA